jgi:hypothetical protein
MNPFDFVKSINDKTETLIERNSDCEREYLPFIVNRAFSQFPDCVMVANTMNTMHHLDKKMQYDYLYYSIKRNKRFSRWVKPVRDNENEELLIEYYKINRVRAREYLGLINTEDLEKIIKKTYIGGTKKS